MTSMSVNQASNLLAFLEAWSEPDHDRNCSEVDAHVTRDGRITDLHDPSPGRGPLVARHHPRFGELLEPAVRDLVLRLVSTWNLVTYSSCEGHLLPDGRIMPWCIGALDLGGIASRMLHLLDSRSRDLRVTHEAVSLRVERGTLHTGSTFLSIVELQIRPKSDATWEDYRAARDLAADGLLRTEQRLAEEFAMHS